MQINYIGIIASIIAFISLMLPWWTMPMSGTHGGIPVSMDVSVYTFDARTTIGSMWFEETKSMVDGFSIWYGYVALALIAIAGISGIVGSVMVGKTGKTILIVAGICLLLSLCIFAVGLNIELFRPREDASSISEYTNLRVTGSFGLFSRGTYSANIPEMGYTTLDYSTYLTFGFWLALVAAIINFVSSKMHPVAPLPTPPPAEQVKAAKFFCRYCGKENKLDAAYCEGCGKKL